MYQVDMKNSEVYFDFQTFLMIQMNRLIKKRRIWLICGSVQSATDKEVAYSMVNETDRKWDTSFPDGCKIPGMTLQMLGKINRLIALFNSLKLFGSNLHSFVWIL